MNEPEKTAWISARHTYIVFYVILLAFAHEYAYWSAFNVHLLEHIGLADLPKLAVWPIVATAGVLVIGPGISMLVGSRILPPGAGAHTSVGIKLEKFRKPIGLLLILSGLLLSSVDVLSEEVWMVWPALFTSGVWIGIDVQALFERLGIKLRYPLDFFIVFLPCLALAMGHSEALKIVNGHEYIEAHFQNSGTTLRYLGRAGDYVFFWDSNDKDTEIYRLDSIQPLTLIHKRQIAKKSTAT